MGLQDLSLRLTNAEAAAEYARRWILNNYNSLTEAISLSNRVGALENASISTYVPALKSYADLFGNDGLGFLFFTDPHFFSDNIEYYQLINNLKTFGALYRNSPARFVLCGGDMINERHTLADAKYWLGRIPNLLRAEITERTYIAVGNHDLNVHQPVDGSLTEAELAQIWYGTDVGYFDFDEGNTKVIVTDSGSMIADMTPYRWTQVDWFAHVLLGNDKDHLFGVQHIMGNGPTSYPRSILGDTLMAIADAFNFRQSIIVNGLSYDFANAHGTFHFMLAGHYHEDLNDVINYIPVLYTKSAGRLSVDMCYADWDAHVLRTVRYPTTETSRTMPMVFTGDPDNALPIWGVTTGSSPTSVDRSTLSGAESYGTSLGSTTYDGTIHVMQSSFDANYAWDNYRNGTFSICVGGLVSGETYRMTADCTIDDNPLSDDRICIFSRVSNSHDEGTTTSIVNGKIDAIFTAGSANTGLAVGIRLGGKSLTISNVKFERIYMIDGLPVLMDNVRLLSGNNLVDGNLQVNNEWFVTGWFDTGSEASKTYTVTHVPFANDGAGNSYLRFYNDKDGSSRDNWSISGSTTRTLTSAGRYVICSVNKAEAANFYIHDDTNDRYICKGSNVS